MTRGRFVTVLGVGLLALLAACGGEGAAVSESGMACSGCDGEIPFDTPYHSLTLSHEQRDPDGITVLESTALVEFCETCAGTRNLESAMKVLHTGTGVLVPLDELAHVHGEHCWDCGSRLGTGAYFSMVHYHEKLLPVMEVEVINAVDVLYLCPGCRRNYDFGRLELESLGG